MAPVSQDQRIGASRYAPDRLRVRVRDRVGVRVRLRLRAGVGVGVGVRRMRAVLADVSK